MAHISVIDDDPAIRLLIAHLLLRDGHQVLTYADGMSAVIAIITQPPALVVCDIDMPGLDGFGVLTRLRTEPVTAAIPFIFVTARDDPESRQRALRWGADAYLTKNRLMDDLAAVVLEHLAPGRAPA